MIFLGGGGGMGALPLGPLLSLGLVILLVIAAVLLLRAAVRAAARGARRVLDRFRRDR